MKSLGENYPWIVFIHGAGGSIETWKFQESAFSGSANLLFIDLRDHGKSTSVVQRGKYDFDLISSDILEVIDSVGINKAIFISLSFGSVLLQALAERRPGMVQAAIMAGAIFKGSIAIRLFVHLARFFNIFLPYRKMYSLFSYLLMPKESHQLSRRIYRIQARKITPEAYMRWLGLYGEFFRLLRSFWNQRINFPILAVMGSDDYVFLNAARSFAGKHRTVTLRIIQGAGHICNIDNSPEFNRISLSYLKSLGFLSDVPVEPAAEIAPEDFQGKVPE